MRKQNWFLLALLLALFLPPPRTRLCAESLSAERTKRKAKNSISSLFKRTVVLGASVSAGFGTVPETGVPVGIAQILREALGEEVQVFDLSDLMFFRSPFERGRKSVERALKFRPTCVIALDFLFWFCYGRVSEEKKRLLGLEVGLGFLKSLISPVPHSSSNHLNFSGCPLVIGDIPDMSQAAGIMLGKDSVPRKETLEKANLRIASFAEGKSLVRLVKLSYIEDQLRRGNSIKVGDSSLSWKEVFSGDKLHLNLLGTCAILILAMQELQDICPSLSSKRIFKDPRALRSYVIKRLREKRKAKKAEKKAINRAR